MPGKYNLIPVAELRPGRAAVQKPEGLSPGELIRKESNSAQNGKISMNNLKYN